MKTSKQPFLPITRVAEGQLLESFESAFDDKVAVSSLAFHCKVFNSSSHSKHMYTIDWK